MSVTLVEAVLRIRGDNSSAVKAIRDTERDMVKAGPRGAAAGVAMGAGFTRGADGKLKDARGKFGAATGAIGSDAEKAGGRVGRASSGMAGALKGVGMVAAGMGLAAVLGDSVREAEDAARTQAKLGQVMSQMGYGQHTAAVQAYGEALGEKLALDNDEIANVQMRLGTYGELAKVADQENGLMQRATQAAYDMAAARGEDASAATNYADMLGKALNSPEMAAALSRTGTLSKAEAEQIALMAKSGKTAEARAAIMAAVEKQYGGAAEKNVTGTQKMAVAAGALKEQLGTALLPVVNVVAGAFSAVAGWMGQNEGAVKILVPVVLALAGALGVAAIATWAMNSALLANPITWVIVAIVALVAAVVVMYQKFAWFKTIIDVIWDVFQNLFGWIVTGAKWVFETVLVPYFKVWWTVVSTVFKAVWEVVKWVWGAISTGFKAAWAVIKVGVEWLKGAWNGLRSILIDPMLRLWNFIKELPGKIGGVFKGLVNILSFPFRTAFNLIARLWNNTLGRMSFSVPDWVPGLGGKGFAMPRIPELQGLATGTDYVGQGGYFNLHKDETVFLPRGSAVAARGSANAAGARGAAPTIVVNVAGDADAPKVRRAFEEMWAAKEAQGRMASLQAVGYA